MSPVARRAINEPAATSATTDATVAAEAPRSDNSAGSCTVQPTKLKTMIEKLTA